MRGMSLEQAVEFADNPEPRCPCVLLLDTSGSMQDEPIRALNEGLRAFHNDLLKDPLAARRVEVAVVAFDSEVRVVRDFATAELFHPPTLTAQGLTHMAGGIHRALDMVQARKEAYRASGIAYYRPWVFLITDGEPQGEAEDVIQLAAKRIHCDEAAKRVAFFAVGVERANMEKLAQLVVRPPMKLHGLNFVEMLVWLSRSTQAVSRSTVDDHQLALPAPGWGTLG